MDKPKPSDFLLKRVGLRSAARYAKACPRCGSLRIELSSQLDLWLTPRRYVCNNCGYIGPIVLELEKEDVEKEEGEN